MQLEGLKEEQHTVLKLVGVLIHDNGSLSFMNKQDFAALVPVVKSFEIAG
jgi:hypothetical protein